MASTVKYNSKIKSKKSNYAKAWQDGEEESLKKSKLSKLSKPVAIFNRSIFLDLLRHLIQVDVYLLLVFGFDLKGLPGGRGQDRWQKEKLMKLAQKTFGLLRKINMLGLQERC